MVQFHLRKTAILLGALAAIISGPTMARPLATPFIPVGAAADAPTGFVEMCTRHQSLCQPATPQGDWSSRPLNLTAITLSPIAQFTPVASLDHSVFAPAPAAPCVTTISLPVMLTPFALSPAADTPFLAFATPRCRAAPLPVQPAPAKATRKQELRLLKTVNALVNRAVSRRSDTDSFGVDERWERPGIGQNAAGDCEDIALEKRMQLIDAGFPESHLFFAVVFKQGFGLHTVLIARISDGDYVLDSLTPHILPWVKTSYSWLRLQSPQNPLDWRRLGHS